MNRDGDPAAGGAAPGNVLAMLVLAALVCGVAGFLIAPRAAASAAPAAPRPHSINAPLRAEVARLEAELVAASLPPAQADRPTPPAASPPAAGGPAADRPPGDGLSAAQVEVLLDDLQDRLAKVENLRGLEAESEQLRMLSRGHLGQVLAARAESRSWGFTSLVDKLLPGLLGPADRAVVLTWLPRIPCLVQVVLANHWEREAHATLLAGLARPMAALDQEVLWVRAVAASGDPADQPLLAEVLVRSQYGYWRRDLYRELKDLPGFPLQQTVERAWATARANNGGEAFYPVAAGHGIYTALAGVVGAVPPHGPSHLSADTARAWLTSHSDAPGDPQLLTAWLGTAADPPRFDPATRRWIRDMTGRVVPDGTPALNDKKAEKKDDQTRDPGAAEDVNPAGASPGF